MRKTAALQAYARFCKNAEAEPPPDFGANVNPYMEEMRQKQLIEQAIEDAMYERALSPESEFSQDDERAAFQDPYYQSPLERKRQMQGGGAAIGSGAGLLGGSIAGAMLPKSMIAKALGGVGGGLGGMALGGLGGWGIGSLLARSRMGEDYPQE